MILFTRNIKKDEPYTAEDFLKEPAVKKVFEGFEYPMMVLQMVYRYSNTLIVAKTRYFTREEKKEDGELKFGYGVDYEKKVEQCFDEVKGHSYVLTLFAPPDDDFQDENDICA